MSSPSDSAAYKAYLIFGRAISPTRPSMSKVSLKNPSRPSALPPSAGSFAPPTFHVRRYMCHGISRVLKSTGTVPAPSSGIFSTPAKAHLKRFETASVYGRSFRFSARSADSLSNSARILPYFAATSAAKSLLDSADVSEEHTPADSPASSTRTTVPE